MDKRTAFTLIELLVVVIIIAILASIAIPKFAYSRQEALEASTRLQLDITRDALQRFNSDTGMWPINPDDMASVASPSLAYNNGGQTKPLNPATYNGPYLSTPTIPQQLSGWVQYSWVGGSVKAQFWCPKSGTALDGTLYSTW